MATRYVRDEELIAHALRATRQGLRDVQRPTGTEKAQTTQVAVDAAASAASALEAAAGAVTATVVEYAPGIESEPPTSGWSTASPTRAPGVFVWMRTIVTYGDESTATTTPVLVTGNAGATGATGSTGATGATGAAGAAGVSVSTVQVYYRTTATSAAAPAAPTTTAPPAPWSLTEPAYVADTALWATTRVGYSNATFAYTPVSKVSAYTAAAEAAAAALALRMRGTDLITNGNAGLGNTTNFSTWTLYTGDQPAGAAGAFGSGVTTAQWNRQIDELIPVDPAKAYLMAIQAKQNNAGVASSFYAGLVPYDVDGLSIAPASYMEQTGTRTTLAAPLNNGDTTITLTSSAGWNNTVGAGAHLRTIIVWNWVDGKGKLWEPGTYSRRFRVDAYAAGGIVGNVVTLRAPWSHGAVPAGTAISNGSSGGSYMYAPGISGAAIPTSGAWTSYVASAPFTGVHSNLTASASTAFPIATAFVKALVLGNYAVSGGTSDPRFAIFSLSEATAARAAAVTADGKATAAQSTANQSLEAQRVQDTRTTNEPPSYYWANHARMTVTELKLLSAVGVPTSGTIYGTMSTWTPWGDSSGGPIQQRFHRADGQLFARRSSSTTAWTAWVNELADAQAAAAAAQTTASNAATAAADAAGIAGGKADVLIQAAAPGPTFRKVTTLWIDTTGGLNTPKRWTTGTTWVSVTDKVALDAAAAAVAAASDAADAQVSAVNAAAQAADAQSAAQTAQNAADEASGKADTAQGTADGAVTLADGAKSSADQAKEDARVAQETADAARQAAADTALVYSRGDNEATIQQPGSPNSLAFTNEEIQFRQSDVAKAWLNAGEFVADQLVAQRQLVVGPLLIEPYESAPGVNDGVVFRF